MTRAAPRENRRTRVVRTFFTSNRFFSATSAMIACEPGSRGRGATHTVRGRGEILKLVSIRGVEFANRNVNFDDLVQSSRTSESRLSLTTTGVARLKTVACLHFGVSLPLYTSASTSDARMLVTIALALASLSLKMFSMTCNSVDVVSSRRTPPSR